MIFLPCNTHGRVSGSSEMFEASGLLTRVGWHASFWLSAITGTAIAKTRLSTSWEERQRDLQAGENIIRHFESSWMEGEELERSLILDLKRKLDTLFPIDELMKSLENVNKDATNVANVEEVRAQKLGIWEELKIEVFTRMVVVTYANNLLSQFVTVAMALVGKGIYLHSILKESVNGDDLTAAHRIFLCLSGRFIQNGLGVLTESVRNALRAVFAKVPLQEQTSRILLDSLICQVRHEVETACGKSVLDDCLFGRLDEMIGADITPARRRIFMALTSEARRRIKSSYLRTCFTHRVNLDLEELLASLLENGATMPLISLIPKVSRSFQTQLLDNTSVSSSSSELMKRYAAVIFVDTESYLYNLFVPLESIN